MSLRLRLTLRSTLILGAVFAIFGAVAYFAVQFLLYQAVDDNLDREATANILYFQARQRHNLNDLGNDNEIGIVYYTVLTTDGRVYSADKNVPVDDQMFTEALEGQSPMKYETLPDGTRVRVLMKRLIDAGTGETAGVLQAATPLAFVDTLLRELSIFLGVVALLLIGIAAVGSYMLTGRTLTAVDRVTQKAHEIETSQDLTQRIPGPGTRDEVGNLVDTFNQMLDRLQAAFEAQRRFVADSSHELRTPLTVIRSNLHLLRRAKDKGEQTELIETSEAEVGRLNGMVNDLLYMAQMQAGHIRTPVLRTVELDSLLLDVLGRARSLASLKGQRVQLVHEDIAATQGDRDQLQHLLLNLVDNACKYTPEGGTITLGLWTEQDWARIEVGDTGQGISPEEVPYIFERFYRTPDARKTGGGGSGLGLAIVKSIAESHTGKVEVFSELGKGTTFRVWLPAMPTLPLPAEDDDLVSDLAAPEPLPTSVAYQAGSPGSTAIGGDTITTS